MSEEAVKRNSRKTRRGVVVSRSGDKSIVVEAERRLPHPQYGKIIRQTRKYHVHDPDNRAVVGETVDIVECRPLSATKRWRLAGQADDSKGAK
ncbi:MAG: 30S ribosomal protein S17 [Lentisphaerae bacterium]|nr:30S ribosomal protein S17 [Lentisphaerota bacterium]